MRKSVKTTKVLEPKLARIHNLDHLLQLVDQLLTMRTTTAFDQAILACLPGNEEGK